MRRQLLLALGTLLLAGCPAGFTDLCDNGACVADASVNDTGIDAPLGCEITKDPKDSPKCVDDGVGIFVDAAGGKDTNPGRKKAPMQTIAAALGKTDTQHARLYVCAGTYAEDLLLDASHDGVSIYGGWQCSDWSYLATAQPLIGKTNLSAKLSALTKPVAIEDVHIKAANAGAAGDSSIAVFVANSPNVTFTRVMLEAGTGQNGAPGTLTKYTYPSMLNGNPSTGIDGGSQNSTPCPAGDTTVGGAGGYGNGSDGQDGTPGPSNKGTDVVCAGSNTGGGNGVNGDAGAAAIPANSLGTLASTGWAPSNGPMGGSGGCGQGGGGGAGRLNGGGGGGGCGGCGGAAGGGGGGGGGSIALAAFGGVVTVNMSALVATTSGNGGNGVGGQAGDTNFGFGGNKTLGGCNGGNGGTGGNGGAGAGGAGGVSVGVLWKGSLPSVDSSTSGQITVGAKGAKGIGGNAGVNDGIVGVAQAVLQSP